MRGKRGRINKNKKMGGEKNEIGGQFKEENKMEE
jgi:hypothetical protein